MFIQVFPFWDKGWIRWAPFVIRFDGSIERIGAWSYEDMGSAYSSAYSISSFEQLPIVPHIL